jgi:CMP-N-acetylneuraminic acid synthetase
MRVVIPAKASSTRSKEKNWRVFHNGMSLLDILIEKLLRCGIDAQDIVLSSESQSRLQRMVDKWGVSASLRDKYYTDLHTPTPVWIAEMMQSFSADEDVALALCTTPTFDEHQAVIDRYMQQNIRAIAVAQRAPSHLLIEYQGKMQPIAWSLGSHHTTSQFVIPFYQMMFSFQIMKAADWHRYSYYTCPDSVWHIASDQHIDINTDADFRDAQAVYASRFQ